jgi:spore maturation protein SpmA
MRSKTAAVVLALSSVALLFGLTTATASAAVPAHAEVTMQASAFPIGLTGFSSFVVLLGLVGLAVGLTRLGRRSRAAKRAAAQVKPAVSTVPTVSIEEPARTSA